MTGHGYPARLDDLDARTWRRVSELLDEALELSPGELEAFLDRSCAGDAALRACLESLIAADANAGGFLERPVADFASSLLADEAHPAPAAAAAAGERIGAWRLLREIGHGGMGTVHLAERADGAFEQRAAIKLVRRAVLTDEVRARFLRERRILARLEHPHIARVLDGGVTSDGAPFLAMEYVEGEPLTAWFRRTRPDLRTVLSLFLQVCRAVEHAHQNLIVHRDLKPGNILVSSSGEAKLLDFGIAKLLEPDADEGEPGTQTVDRRLTPHYAAPEQIRGEPPTTATDVYSLGVVLYELLSGARPHHARSSSVSELEQAVLHDDPAPPSVAAARADGSTREPEWRRRVRGDLDAIVLQALRKDPAARYATVRSLAEDVERFLAGRPVGASRPTAVYRLKKLVARNPLLTIATAGVAAAIVAGIVGMEWQAQRARAEQRKAEAIRDFALGLFRSADPSEAKGDTLKAREILDRGFERVERELRDQPALQADMLQTLGGVYRELDLLERAQSVYEKAATLRRQTLGAKHPLYAASLVDVGAVLNDQAKYADAERRLTDALGILRAGERATRAERARALCKLAVAYQATERSVAAESLYRSAIALDEAVSGAEGLPVAQDLDDLGTLFYERSRYDLAAPIYERALAIRLKRQGRDHVSTATTMQNLATALVPIGQAARADSLQRAALEIYIRLIGPESMAVGNLLSNLGVNYLTKAEYARSESAMSQAARIFRLRLGPGHPETGRALNNLAFLYGVEFRFAEAESLYRIAADVWERALGTSAALTNNARNNLAAVLREQGRFEESERLFRFVLDQNLKRAGPDDVATANTYHQMAALYLRTGRDAEAERFARRAVNVRRARAGGNVAPLGASLGHLGEALLALGRLDEARAAYSEAIALDRSPDASMDAFLGATLGLGRVLVEAREFARAESLITRVVARRDSLVGRNSLRTIEARAALGMCYAAAHRDAEAEALLASALPALERWPGCPAGLRREAREALALVRGSHAARGATANR